MNKDQLEARLQSKQEELSNLEAAHAAFVDQFNKQVADNRDRFNQLQGSIKELTEQIENFDTT